MNTILILKQMSVSTEKQREHNYTAIISNYYTTNVSNQTYCAKNGITKQSKAFLFSYFICLNITVLLALKSV